MKQGVAWCWRWRWRGRVVGSGGPDNRKLFLGPVPRAPDPVSRTRKTEQRGNEERAHRTRAALGPTHSARNKGVLEEAMYVCMRTQTTRRVRAYAGPCTDGPREGEGQAGAGPLGSWIWLPRRARRCAEAAFAQRNKTYSKHRPAESVQASLSHWTESPSGSGFAFGPSTNEVNRSFCGAVGRCGGLKKDGRKSKFHRETCRRDFRQHVSCALA